MDKMCGNLVAKSGHFVFCMWLKGLCLGFPISGRKVVGLVGGVLISGLVA